MTKISLGLAALAFAAIAPIAAEAATHHSKIVERNSTFTNCKTDSDFSFCGQNLVGQPETSYKLFDGGGGSLLDSSSGAPVVKVMQPATNLYSGGNG